MDGHVSARRLRSDWPYRRLAVVLSGGGALGAYQVGVLKVLHALGIEPAIVGGISVGAINAVGWVSQGFATDRLERTWLRLGPSSIGLRFTSLALRVAGAGLVVLGALEFTLALLGSPDTGLARQFLHLRPVPQAPSWAYDAVAWLLVAALGVVAVAASRFAEGWFATAALAGDPERWVRWFGRALLAGLALHVAAWLFDWPWPHRFSATLLLLGTLLWVANRRGRTGDWVRAAVTALFPESGGRGLWRGLARRRLLAGVVAEGDATRLTSGAVRLLLNAVAVDNGRMCYFVNWSPPEPAFVSAVERAMGEVQVLERPEELLEAAAAASAIPMVFEPVRFRGRDYLDASMFASQTLRVTAGAGADALLVALMSPSACPRPASEELNLFEVGSRLFELAGWRDLRSDLGTLPPPWSREGDPASICVVEPDTLLPGGMLRFEPREALELVRRGEEDAWRALERAGWLEPAAAGSAPTA